MHTWLHICIHESMIIHLHIQARVRRCRHTCIYTCMQAYMHTCIHAYMPTYILAWCVYMHTHTHIYIYVIFIFEYPYVSIHVSYYASIYVSIYVPIYLILFIAYLFYLVRFLTFLALQLSTARGLAAQLPLSLPTRLVKTSGRCHGFTESVGWNMLKSCHPALLQLFLIDSANTGSPLDSLDHEPTWEVDPLHVILCVLSTLEDQTEF